MLNVTAAASTVAGVHDFPLAWRVDAYKVNWLPILNQAPLPAPASKTRDLQGQHVLAASLLTCALTECAPTHAFCSFTRAAICRGPPHASTVIVTGPITSLACV